MTSLVKDRIVAITGAGGGLGRAYALAFAQAGAKLVINDLGVSNHGEGSSQNPADETAKACEALGGSAITHYQDIATEQGASSLVQTALSHFGGLDVVVNNAGFVRDRMFINLDEADWDAVISVHLRGHYCVGQAAARYWRSEHKASRGRAARLINTSSGAGLMGSLGQSAYSAAKAGIAALTLVQAVELARYDICVNALAPSARTRMTEEVFADMMRPPEHGFDPHKPENIAPLVVWLGSVESSKITGQIFEISGGMISIAQGWRHGVTIDKKRLLSPEEAGQMVGDILKQTPAAEKVYGS